MLFSQEERVSTSLSSDLPGSRPTAFWARPGDISCALIPAPGHSHIYMNVYSHI
jgi:hypothetical protein